MSLRQVRAPARPDPIPAGRGARSPRRSETRNIEQDVEGMVTSLRGLAIKDVAERTGIAAGTIRMWEQRYGFPEPERTTAGYRVYSEEDVEALRRVVAYRERGLSVPAAVDRARSSALATDRPSLYGVLAAGDAPLSARVLTQAHADRGLAGDRGRDDLARRRAGGHRRRSRASATTARSSTATARWRGPPTSCSRSPTSRRSAGGGDAPVEVPLQAGDGLANEWAVVVDAPGYCACLLAWEQPRSAEGAVPDLERTFEAMWTLDPRVVRRAAEAGGDARAPRRRGARRAARGPAGGAAARDGAAGARPDRPHQPDDRLLGRLSGAARGGSRRCDPCA